MENNEHLRRTLEDYRRRRQQKLEEVRRIDSVIQQLLMDLGESDASAEEELTPEEASPNASLLGPSGSSWKAITIRPDEFFGLSQSEASKAYLRKVGHAVPYTELVNALQKGGARLGGQDPAKTLYVSLARNPKKEFVWPSDDHISLAEFYQQRKDSGK